MPKWTSDELTEIGNAEELRIASLRREGALTKLVTIWAVRLGGDLYVRSVNGRTSAWCKGTQTSGQGHIRAGGVNKDVSFVEEADPDLNNLIDAEYRNKYRRYAKRIVDSIVSPKARAATIRLKPQESV